MKIALVMRLECQQFLTQLTKPALYQQGTHINEHLHSNQIRNYRPNIRVSSKNIHINKKHYFDEIFI